VPLEIKAVAYSSISGKLRRRTPCNPREFLDFLLSEDAVIFCAQSPRLSPQTFYLITVESSIPANYCTFLSDTLAYEEAIEGISMMEWQRSER
jgi:hypothetical protein